MTAEKKHQVAADKMQKVKITPRDPQYTNKAGVKNDSEILSSKGHAFNLN